MKTVVLLAPWWQDPAHVGNIRLKRHVRWFQEAGWHVVLVDSGHEYSIHDEPGLTHITIADPIRMHVKPSEDGPPPRKPNALRRWLAYALLVPDPSIFWARRVLAHPVIRHAVRTADLITSSSPPEAAFMACATFSKRYGIPFWMDMRDGWLDEPLKPLLRSSALQRFRERRLESWCLSAASIITVTSENWKTMLADRYPAFSANMHVLTNAAPDPVDAEHTSQPIPELVYAGRLFSSRPERQTPDLNKILSLLPKHQFTILGHLVPEEQKQVNSFGWGHIPFIPRDSMLPRLSEASGLVFLSTSHGSIPAKWYDYLATGRPILGITNRGSAAWEAMSGIDHAFAVDPKNPDKDVLNAFYRALSSTQPASIPTRFSTETVRTQFMTLFGPNE